MTKNKLKPNNFFFTSLEVCLPRKNSNDRKKFCLTLLFPHTLIRIRSSLHTLPKDSFCVLLTMHTPIHNAYDVMLHLAYMITTKTRRLRTMYVIQSSVKS